MPTDQPAPSPERVKHIILGDKDLLPTETSLSLESRFRTPVEWIWTYDPISNSKMMWIFLTHDKIGSIVKQLFI